MRRMITTTLSRLVDRFPVVERRGALDPEISRVCYDSRTAGPDALFVAVAGDHVDGHDYIDDAIARGCRAIVCERVAATTTDEVVWLQVTSSRQALSALAARLYDNPSRELAIVGVTGTDGKTTATYLIDQLLTALDEESGFVSTALIKRDVALEKNPFRQSTPEAPEVHGFLREMVENGKEIAVVEATSHGLSERTARLRDVQFRVAVFTNITHEHLEFHGSFEQYRSDKANLFRMLDRTASERRDCRYPIFGVVNIDDPNAYYFRQATRQRVLTYSTRGAEADLRATDLSPRVDGTECVIHWRREARRVFVPLPGPFNVENVLAAILAASQLVERNPLDLLDMLKDLRLPPGRMDVIARDLPFVPIVDYAHTPGAFEKVLPMIRDYTPGRLIVVFGSAGERDIAKRAMQGRLAARFAHTVVLTDEDPRGEDRLAIIEQIAEGCRAEDASIAENDRLALIPDRRAAIRHAVAIAREGDTVLCLGKGHEGSIIYADGPIDWDDATVLREELARAAGNGASA